MVARDTEADFAVDLEAAGGGEETEGGWTQWVAGWEHDAAVVNAAGVWGGRGRAGEGEVPVVEVGVGDRVGGEVRGGVGGEFGSFF